MDLESKIISRELLQALYDNGKTIGTAESCTGGRLAQTIIAAPGASNYFKGGIVCYTDEVKQNLLNVDPEAIREHTAVSEIVARQPQIPVGTIWIAYGELDDIRTFKLSDDNGRDRNLTAAASTALKLFLEYIKEKNCIDNES